jgi:hypothetical protein
MNQIAQDLAQALSLMQAALSLLDGTDVAHEVGAHLDLAIHRLSDLLAGDGLVDDGLERANPLNV